MTLEEPNIKAAKGSACTAVFAKSYADLTAVGVAASTLLVVLVESESCTTPATEVVAVPTLTVTVPLLGEAVIGLVPRISATPPPPPDGVTHCVL